MFNVNKMNNILTPDKNSLYLKKYHTSSKLLIPLLTASYLSHKYNLEIPDKTLGILNVANIGFHSYVSTSCIITDYVKPTNISSLLRFSNFGLHGLAISGFIYTILNNNNLKK